MVKRCIVSSIVIMLTMTVQTAIGAPEERQVTLSQAIATAMEENHEIRATKNSLLAQKADIGIARDSLLPQICFEQRVARTNNPPGVFMSKLNQERFTQADLMSTHSITRDPSPTCRPWSRSIRPFLSARLWSVLIWHERSMRRKVRITGEKGKRPRSR